MRCMRKVRGRSVASIAGGISATDTANWNNKQNQLIAGSNITINGNTISASAGGGGFTHHIGEGFGGGVIFHLWKDAQGVEHGLIVDKTDLSFTQSWSNISNTLIGTTAQSRWDGLSNSNAIVAQAGQTTSAASLCLNSTNGGQSDWYLPSILELSLLWNNHYNVSRSLSQISGATQLATETPSINPGYWSSTEVDNINALKFFFSSGSVSQGDKSCPDLSNPYCVTTYVRAIRAF